MNYVRHISKSHAKNQCKHARHKLSASLPRVSRPSAITSTYTLDGGDSPGSRFTLRARQTASGPRGHRQLWLP